MSTRSNIGILNQDGSVEFVYCHFDGYPSHNGKLLLENYKNFDQVSKLIELGDLSQLGDTRESCVAYHRDRGEILRKPMLLRTTHEVLGNMEEYLYLFDVANERWVYSNHGKPLEPLKVD